MHFILVTTLCQLVNKETEAQRSEMVSPALQVNSLGHRCDSTAWTEDPIPENRSFLFYTDPQPKACSVGGTQDVRGDRRGK